MEKHSIPPYYNSDSEILILGSFPSIKSREIGFYYSHPQNRFWPVLSTIFNEPLPLTIEAKKALLKKHKIALFDVCKSCNIKRIYLDGKTAYNLYNKLLKPQTNIEGIYLPSTSPANAQFTLSALINAYKVLTKNENM